MPETSKGLRDPRSSATAASIDATPNERFDNPSEIVPFRRDARK
jgi:hypothetical protein